MGDELLKENEGKELFEEDEEGNKAVPHATGFSCKELPVDTLDIVQFPDV